MQSGGSSSSSPLMEFRRQQEETNYNTTTPPPPIRNSAFTRPLSVAPPLVLSGLSLGARNGGTVEPKDPDPTPSAPSPTTEPLSPAEVRYRECLRNHAAALGGHVLDGCGEFMPSAGDAMKCAACGCHRSFHRKDSDEQYGGDASFYSATHHLHNGGRPVPLLLPPPPPPQHAHRHNKPFYSGYHPSPPAIAASGGTTTESSSEELNAGGGGDGCATTAAAAGGAYSGPPTKKRFRTKFTAGQKERMLEFAHGVGWRIQKQDEAEMERFCAEIGVSRQVLKVWMHNNKHISMIKKPKHLDHQHQTQHQHQQQPQEP